MPSLQRPKPGIEGTSRIPSSRRVLPMSPPATSTFPCRMRLDGRLEPFVPAHEVGEAELRSPSPAVAPATLSRDAPTVRHRARHVSDAHRAWRARVLDATEALGGKERRAVIGPPALLEPRVGDRVRVVA